ncbi:hypothetical protein [Pseudomonas canadensis]|uniref:hypothetical protein n=1 Tax=Pseudomonas canadensis TaxID=915099 RepID=UPI002735CF50|nr:hypothetical protein [Pseudomonas canadensis]WLH29947.1 hypothetical protein PSH56_28635 [Pseudomonas canadensis]
MTNNAEHPFTELISIAAKAGIGLLPGGGLLTAGYEGLLLLSNQAAAQMERRSEKRYEEFIQNIFAGEVTPEVTEHLTADDYTALLSGCLADMENEKARYYGRLAAAIGRGEVQGRNRRFLIITLSQVSDEQLQMLRKSSIATRFDLKPSRGNGRVDPVEILHLRDSVQKHEYDELVSRSMYIDKKLTELAEELVRACFTTEELKPSAIGYVCWLPKLVDIIFDTNQFALVDSLINGFWSDAIRTSNRSVAVIDRPALANFASPRVMVVGSEVAPEYLIALKARLKNNEVLFVCLYDHVLHIQAHYPDSIIINAQGWSIPQITETVVNHVKAANGLLEVT